MELIVAGTRQGILMVEGQCKFISEADALAALKFGHQSLMPLFNAQDELREKTGSKKKREFNPAQIEESFKLKASELMKSQVLQALKTRDKGERYALYDKAFDSAKKDRRKTW